MGNFPDFRRVRVITKNAPTAPHDKPPSMSPSKTAQNIATLSLQYFKLDHHKLPTALN